MSIVTFLMFAFCMYKSWTTLSNRREWLLNALLLFIITILLAAWGRGG